MYASLNLSNTDKGMIRIAQGNYEREHGKDVHQLWFAAGHNDYQYDYLMVELSAGKLFELHETIGRYLEGLAEAYAAQQKEGAQA